MSAVSVSAKPPERGPLIPCACGCGRKILQFDDRNREHRYVNGHAIRVFWRAVKQQLIRPGL